MELKPGYKRSEVGVIPGDWMVKPISQVAPLQRGFDLPTREIRPGPFPVVYSNGVKNFHNVAMVKGPGVVTGRSGTLGKVHYIDTDYWPHNTSLWVTHFNDNIPKFIYYLYKSLSFGRFASGSGVPTLNRNDAHSYHIALPSDRNEQRAIATALNDVDALLGGLDRLIAKKRDLKQAAMQQLLTGQTRLPGFNGGWEVKRLGEALTICHGKNQREVAVAHGPFPILATGGQIGTASRPLFDEPSVLIGRKGTINQPQYMESPFWTVDTLFYCSMKDGNDAKFFYYRFCLIDWMQFNEASGVPSLNARTIEKIKILCPQPPEQVAIAAVLSDMDAEIAALEARRNKTRDLKQAMMQELLTGKTRLVAVGGAHA